jgi:hypothetical protein
MPAVNRNVLGHLDTFAEATESGSFTAAAPPDTAAWRSAGLPEAVRAGAMQEKQNQPT